MRQKKRLTYKHRTRILKFTQSLPLWISHEKYGSLPEKNACVHTNNIGGPRFQAAPGYLRTRKPDLERRRKPRTCRVRDTKREQNLHAGDLCGKFECQEETQMIHPLTEANRPHCWPGAFYWVLPGMFSVACVSVQSTNATFDRAGEEGDTPPLYLVISLFVWHTTTLVWCLKNRTVIHITRLFHLSPHNPSRLGERDFPYSSSSSTHKNVPYLRWSDPASKQKFPHAERKINIETLIQILAWFARWSTDEKPSFRFQNLASLPGSIDARVKEGSQSQKGNCRKKKKKNTHT